MNEVDIDFVGNLCTSSLQYNGPSYHNYSHYFQIFYQAAHSNSVGKVLDFFFDKEDFDIEVDHPSKALEEGDHNVIYSMAA